MSDPFSLDDDLPAAPQQPVWLAGLNDEQHRAVTLTDGPLLVLSGAGTGKTRVLTARLAHILGNHLAQPWQCLAVTFTNKAAREMRGRVAGLIGPVAEGIWLGTFHAVAVRILRRHAEVVGLKSNFTILDADDQMRLLKQVMEAERLDAKKYPPQAVMAAIQRWKDRGLAAGKLDGEAGGDSVVRNLYAQYQQRLAEVNACDFGDLLLHNLTLFLSQPEVLADYQNQFRYILVDEYQDTNVAQYLWLRLLAQKHRNLCCVGDDDQSIYSWRGAEVGNILRFERDFPGAQVVRLESNYRSTPHILAAASHLIAHNAGRLGKTLRAGVAQDGGDKVTVRAVWDGEQEARAVVEDIEARQRAGDRLSSIAILVRAGFQTREFEERLITTGLPYRVIGGPRFYERAEIRDAMAYLRLVASTDDSLAFERIVNLPKRGLGEAALQTIHVTARALKVSLFDAACRLGETDELKPKARAALAGFAGDVLRWRSMAGRIDHWDLAATILDESGYTAMWKADKSPEAPGRLENLKELVAALEEYDSLEAFLEHVALVMENDEKAEADRVSLMTLHGAKGLEFDTVFLPGWEEGLFPHSRSLGENGDKGLEEERRLAYVGLTRARKRVTITVAANRRIYNQWQSNPPSRFVDELPEAHVERIAEQGLHAGGGGSRRWEDSAWTQAAYGPRRPPPVVEATSWKVADRASPGGFQPGARVFHSKFGNGTVLAVDGDKLEIAFDKAGTKKVLDSFVAAV
jgi:DNA helicase-2/ATP-dependent DNA helicase PcrA